MSSILYTCCNLHEEEKRLGEARKKKKGGEGELIFARIPLHRVIGVKYGNRIALLIGS